MGDLIRLEEIKVYRKDGSDLVWTDSLGIARVFKKIHKNVLNAIRNLECDQEFSRLNFEPSNYLDSQGKMQPMYEISRDGFTLLAMGFTGKEATQFKIAYIYAFNKMEEELSNQYVNHIKMSDILESLKHNIIKLTDISNESKSDIGDVKKRVINLEGDVSFLKDDFSFFKNNLNQVIENIRNDIPPKSQSIYVGTIHNYERDGVCPCCKTIQIVKNGKKTGELQFDHYWNKSRNQLHECWAICKSCHANRHKLRETGDFKIRFDAFQMNVEKYQKDMEIKQLKLNFG